MKGIDGLFLRVSVVYFLAGMLLGIFMGMSDDHSQMPTHAHVNLLGWASMALYALVYRSWPEAAHSSLAPWHFWIANVGSLVLVVGVAGIMAGHEATFDPIVVVGSIHSLVGALLFAIIVYTRIGLARHSGHAELRDAAD